MSAAAKAMRSSADEKPLARYAPAQQLGDSVWKDLRALLTAPEQIAQALSRAHGGGWLHQELQARREQLRKGQCGLEQQMERVTRAYHRRLDASGAEGTVSRAVAKNGSTIGVARLTAAKRSRLQDGISEFH